MGSSNNKKVLLAAVGLFLIAGVSYVAWSKLSYNPEGVVCPSDAKMCPDGSYVGRIGPKCEFAACPNQKIEVSLKTFTDSKSGVSFEYPDSLGTRYTEAVDWPPQAQVLDESFSCTEGVSDIDQNGQTIKRTVNGGTYCVTKVAEGAAGSIFEQYAYAFPKDVPSSPDGRENRPGTAVLGFRIRYVQCDNYGEPEKSECESERAAFDLDSIVDQIARTLQIKPVVPEITPKTINGGIQGKVKLGPTCPVMQDPPEEDCADRPYATTLVVATLDGSRVISEFSSDAQGKFKVKVPPGEYVIHTAAVANVLPYCASNGTVAVNENSYTDAIVYCDSGIR